MSVNSEDVTNERPDDSQQFDTEQDRGDGRRMIPHAVPDDDDDDDNDEKDLPTEEVDEGFQSTSTRLNSSSKHVCPIAFSTNED